jgi:phosphoglycerate dehydrogenase-like enzyme
VTLYDNRPQTNEEKIRRARDADVMINSRGAVKWPGEVLRELPKLRFITVCGIGTDSIDLPTAREMGIIVSNIPGKTAPVVSEHGLALMLAAAKRIAFQTAEMKAGRWTRMDNIFLIGKTLGIVGTGPIGAAMARLGRAIGMDVIAWTFHPSDERAAELGVRYVELDELLKTSDVVSLHVKSTPQTHYLIGARELAMMKPNSLLVNTARGAILDTAALIDALNRGHLGGAGIDVYETEPLPPDHPLLACEQVVLCPHNADQTPEGNDLLNAGCVENVIAFLEGKPQNVVT